MTLNDIENKLNEIEEAEQLVIKLQKEYHNMKKQYIKDAYNLEDGQIFNSGKFAIDNIEMYSSPKYDIDELIWIDYCTLTQKGTWSKKTTSISLKKFIDLYGSLKK